MLSDLKKNQIRTAASHRWKCSICTWSRLGFLEKSYVSSQSLECNGFSFKWDRWFIVLHQKGKKKKHFLRLRLQESILHTLKMEGNLTNCHVLGLQQCHCCLLFTLALQKRFSQFDVNQPSSDYPVTKDLAEWGFYKFFFFFTYFLFTRLEKKLYMLMLRPMFLFVVFFECLLYFFLIFRLLS